LLSRYQLVLGSNSPRRKELLAGLGLPFTVKTMPTDESYPADMPGHQVGAYLANKKAEALLPGLSPVELLITADTTVVAGQQLLEKPDSPTQAREMLRTLSGGQHQVITGVALVSTNKRLVFDAVTEVVFHLLSEEEIAYYIQQYQPFDKAGAYGIQEWIGMAGIASIKGSYYNVMGLPVDLLYQQLKTF
jgi:septum formation protein